MRTSQSTFIYRLFVIAIFAILLTPAVLAQEVADTLKIRTRVVFLDALVKDKKTGLPITDLKPDSFELFDDGKPRAISYFTPEGQARKPLALVLILDCRADGAGRFLKRPEVLEAIVEQLKKLAPGDEIAIMAMNVGEDEQREWLVKFTNNPTEIAAGLARVPAFVDKPDQAVAENQKAQKEAAPKESNDGVTFHVDTEKKLQDTPAADKPGVLETETIKGKNGAVVTRTTMKDGSVNVKRTNKSGSVTVELDDIYDMAAAVREATHSAEQDRPNSRPAIIWLSDGIAPIFYEDRDATEQILIRSNATFNSMTTDLRTLFKLLMPIGKPIAGWIGVSLYGSAKYLAKNTGGEALRVNRPGDYGTALAKIMNNLTSRYSLGFAINEDEKDDGRLHELMLRVKAVDGKGKQRRLEINSRRGYYMPKNEIEQASTTK